MTASIDGSLSARLAMHAIKGARPHPAAAPRYSLLVNVISDREMKPHAVFRASMT